MTQGLSPGVMTLSLEETHHGPRWWSRGALPGESKHRSHALATCDTSSYRDLITHAIIIGYQVISPVVSLEDGSMPNVTNPNRTSFGVR